MDDELIHRFRRARRERELVVIEGFHALKHALRFGAELLEAVAVDPDSLEVLAVDLAPDLAGTLAARVEPIDAETLARIVPAVPRTGVVAIARRPPLDLAATLADPRPAPVVLLEDPRNMGNIGACVRVAAAADAAALLTTGEHDPWYPDAVRGGAGLHFALPVGAIAALPRSDRPLLAIDPEGEELAPERLPAARRARLRDRAPRPDQRPPGARRRPHRDPDAGRGLQPEPRHLGRRDALHLAACKLTRRRFHPKRRMHARPPADSVRGITLTPASMLST